MTVPIGDTKMFARPLILFTSLFLASIAAASEQPLTRMDYAKLIENTKAIERCVVPIITKTDSSTGGYEVRATAFFVHDSGLLATAAHVAAAENLFILYQDDLLPCKTIVPKFTIQWGREDETKTHSWDIALLQVEAKDQEAAQRKFPAVQLSETFSFEKGHPVALYGYYDQGTFFAAGSRVSFDALLTTGVISSATLFSVGDTKIGSRIVLDISGGPGSSGSPVFDPNSGKVIGVVVEAKLKRVLSPGDEPGQFRLDWIPIGITSADPIIQVQSWLDKFASTPPETDRPQPPAE
jgi:hypothetical protein